MMLYEFAEEYHNLSRTRKQEGLEVLFTELHDNVDRYQDFIEEILSDAVLLEADDYFGTEGFNV